VNQVEIAALVKSGAVGVAHEETAQYKERFDREICVEDDHIHCVIS
jgi:hypothetical protein